MVLVVNSGLKKTFWADTMTYASHLINRLPSSTIGDKILMEMWSGKAASDYNMLRVFGCPAFYHLSDGKLEPRARKTVFLGLKRGVKCYKLWDSEDRKIVLSRDVTFDESSIVKTSSSQQVESDQTKGISQRVERQPQIVLFHFGCHLL